MTALDTAGANGRGCVIVGMSGSHRTVRVHRRGLKIRVNLCEGAGNLSRAVNIVARRRRTSVPAENHLVADWLRDRHTSRGRVP